MGSWKDIFEHENMRSYTVTLYITTEHMEF